MRRQLSAREGRLPGSCRVAFLGPGCKTLGCSTLGAIPLGASAAAQCTAGCSLPRAAMVERKTAQNPGCNTLGAITCVQCPRANLLQLLDVLPKVVGNGLPLQEGGHRRLVDQIHPLCPPVAAPLRQRSGLGFWCCTVQLVDQVHPLRPLVALAAACHRSISVLADYDPYARNHSGRRAQDQCHYTVSTNPSHHSGRRALLYLSRPRGTLPRLPRQLGSRRSLPQVLFQQRTGVLLTP